MRQVQSVECWEQKLRRECEAKGLSILFVSILFSKNQLAVFLYLSRFSFFPSACFGFSLLLSSSGGRLGYRFEIFLLFQCSHSFKFTNLPASPALMAFCRFGMLCFCFHRL